MCLHWRTLICSWVREVEPQVRTVSSNPARGFALAYDTHYGPNTANRDYPETCAMRPRKKMKHGSNAGPVSCGVATSEPAALVGVEGCSEVVEV